MDNFEKDSWFESNPKAPIKTPWEEESDARKERVQKAKAPKRYQTFQPSWYQSKRYEKGCKIVATQNFIKIFETLGNTVRVKKLKQELDRLLAESSDSPLTDDELEIIYLEKMIEAKKQLITEFTDVSNAVLANAYLGQLRKEEGKLKTCQEKFSGEN